MATILFAALHGALSVGLHNDSDKECLESANAVRLVLTDLTEKISIPSAGQPRAP